MHVPVKTSEATTLLGQTNDAIQLFVNSARLTQPKFELTADNLNAVIRVCRLVDGLPLGIELAGNWAGMLTPDEIAAEIKNNLDFLSTDLRDMPDRQQSVRSVFESSWNRLTNIEQNVFQQLSVFRGGFTRQAAESVTGATLQILMGLVNKSLIQPDYTGRYDLHELLKQYGHEKLQDAGNTDQTRDNHLTFFLKLAEEAEPKLAGSDQITWANRLELEHDNLRAALDWCQTGQSTAELGLRLTGSLGYFWQWRGYFYEGREHLSAALSNPNASERTEARAKALYEAGLLAYVQSDFPRAGALFEESISIYRELEPGNRLSLAHALIMVGDTEIGVGNYTTAVSALVEGLGIMRELGEASGITRALWKLGWCRMDQGDYEQASQYFSEALPFYRQSGDKDGIAMALAGQGEVKLRQGDYGGATDRETS
jgi:tetratricopeptide (TPR) repeat protein